MTWPPVSPGGSAVEMCLSFRIKGLYNTRCGMASDHGVHTKQQEATLVTYCTECYKVA